MPITVKLSLLPGDVSMEKSQLSSKTKPERRLVSWEVRCHCVVGGNPSWWEDRSVNSRLWRFQLTTQDSAYNDLPGEITQHLVSIV